MATYREATEWLDEHYPFFLTMVVNLGDPVYDPTVDTAQVRDKMDGKGWEFAMSPTHFDEMLPAELAGVLVHETLHIALDHLDEVLMTDIYPNNRALTITHEVIINDRLINEGFTIPAEGCFGPALLGEDMSPYSTMQGYLIVLAKMAESRDENLENLLKGLIRPEASSGADGAEGDDIAGSASPNEPGEPSDSQDSSSSAEGDPEDEGEQDGAQGGKSGDKEDEQGDDSGSGSGSSESADDDGASADSEGGNGNSGGAPGDSVESELGGGSGGGPVAGSDSLSSGDLNSMLGTCGGVHLSKENADALRKDILNSAQVAPDKMKQDVSDTLLDKLGAHPDDQQFTKAAGSGMSVSVETAVQKTGLKFAWVKLLSEVNPDYLKKFGRSPAKYRSTWRQPRRSMTHMYPEIMVPSIVREGAPQRKGAAGNKKPLIVLALDLSISIPRDKVKDMIELAHSIPTDLIEVECCTFSTNYVPFDPDSKKNKLASGGTDFSAVEDFARYAARKHKVDYPKAIVCITDGEARFNWGSPTRKQLEDNWHWILLNSRCSHDMRVWNIGYLTDYMS